MDEQPDLVRRCREGDHVAWAELVQRYSRYVYAIAMQAYRLPVQDAEDVFQEVFARAYEHLDRLRDDAAIRPWIGQLTRRLSIDRLRAAKREQPADAEGEGDARAEAVLEHLDEALVVREALGSLNDECRQLLDRFFARDESYSTIGSALELPPGTIASRISCCLVRMRELLEGKKKTVSPV